MFMYRHAHNVPLIDALKFIRVAFVYFIFDSSLYERDSTPLNTGGTHLSAVVDGSALCACVQDESGLGSLEGIDGAEAVNISTIWFLQPGVSSVV